MGLAETVLGSLSFLTGFFSLVWSYLCSGWFHANRVINILNSGKGYKASRSYHKILILGDSLAEGYGDYCSFGQSTGLAPRVTGLIATAPQYRHKWQVCNLGSVLSTSADWSPTAKMLPRGDSCLGNWLGKMRNPIKGSYNLWTSVAGDPRWRDAEIAILALGSDDAMGMSPKETVKNILLLADELAHININVFVSTIPLPADLEHPMLEGLVARNVELKKAFAKRPHSDLISLGPTLDSPKYRRKAYFGSNGRTFGPEGYKLAAEHVLEVIGSALTAVEWKHNKAALSKIN